MGGIASLLKTLNLTLGFIFLIWGGVIVALFFHQQIPYFPAMVQSTLSMPIILKLALFVMAIIDVLTAFNIKEPPMFIMIDWGGLLISIIIAAVATFPMLLSYGIIGKYLPINLQFEIPLIALGGLMIFYGLKALGNFYKIHRMRLVLGY